MLSDFLVVGLKGYFLPKTMNWFTSFLIIKKKRQQSYFTAANFSAGWSKKLKHSPVFGQTRRSVFFALGPFAAEEEMAPWA